MAASVSPFVSADGPPNIYKIKVVVGNSPDVLHTYDESTEHYWRYKGPGSTHLSELFHINNPTGNVLQILAYYDNVQTPKIKWFLTLREDKGEMEPFPRFRSVDDISSGGGVIDHTDFTANSDGSGFFQSLSVKSSDGNNTYYLVSAADRNNPTRIRTSKDEVFCFDFSEKYSDDFLVKLNIGWESIIQRRFEIDGF